MIEHKNVESVIRYYLNFLPPKHVDSIINIGGGITDPYAGLLKRRCMRYVNVDVRSSTKVDYVCDIIRGTKFNDKEFEWGWCSEVLEHIPKRKQKKFVEEVLRICKNVVFTFPLPKHPSFNEDPGHVPVVIDFFKYSNKFSVEWKETKTGRCIVTLNDKHYESQRHETVEKWLETKS